MRWIGKVPETGREHQVGRGMLSRRKNNSEGMKTRVNNEKLKDVQESRRREVNGIGVEDRKDDK